MSKKFIITSITIALLLLGALGGIINYYNDTVEDVQKLNSIKHTAGGLFIDPDIKDNTLANTKGDVKLSLYFRGGNSDRWVKEQDSRLHAYANLVGSIYEVKIENDCNYEIADWYIIQRIHQSCYINNAWSGPVEIHQNVDTEEIIQTIDFSSYSTDDLLLNYEILEGDILIPLNDGDYIIYYPNETVHEVPIAAKETGDNVITTGFIYYCWAGGIVSLPNMDLSDAEMFYYYKIDISQSEAYALIQILGLFWIFAFVLFLIVLITSIVNNKKLAEREIFINESLTVFTHFVDAKDPYTNGHSNRVAEYSSHIAKAMGMSEKDVKNVYYIALLHDVGKCYIDDSILKKPERLTAEEFEEIKKHTVQGAKMLEELKSMPEIYDGAMYHHERYDGKGYPTGKAGEDIPLIARIICVADSFDAMNSNRCYRSRLFKDIIFDEIIKNKGTQFDPNIADVFLKLLNNGTIKFEE